VWRNQLLAAVLLLYRCSAAQHPLFAASAPGTLKSAISAVSAASCACGADFLLERNQQASRRSSAGKCRSGSSKKPSSAGWSKQSVASPADLAGSGPSTTDGWQTGVSAAAGQDRAATEAARRAARAAELAAAFKDKHRSSSKGSSRKVLQRCTQAAHERQTRMDKEQLAKLGAAQFKQRLEAQFVASSGTGPQATAAVLLVQLPGEGGQGRPLVPAASSTVLAGCAAQRAGSSRGSSKSSSASVSAAVSKQGTPERQRSDQAVAALGAEIAAPVGYGLLRLAVAW